MPTSSREDFVNGLLGGRTGLLNIAWSCFLWSSCVGSIVEVYQQFNMEDLIDLTA